MARPTVRTKHQIVAGVEAEFLKRIRMRHGLSRAELARELNLAPSTSGIYVDRLKQEGFLIEGEKVDRQYGRHPTLLMPNPEAGRFVGVDFEAHSLMTTVVDFSLRVVNRSQRTIQPNDSPEKILKKMEDSITAGLEGGGPPLLGVGVGVPGVIDPSSATAPYYEFVAGWNNIPVAERLGAKFGVPISLENNIRSMALAELWLGQGLGIRNFACLGVRTGVGVGLVVNGEPFSGQGGAGEIGLWPATSSDARETGTTLQSVASLSAILEEAGAATGEELDFAALRTAARAGDRRVHKVLDRVAAVHGAAMRQLHLLLEPERIIIVGPLSELGSAFLTPLTVHIGRRFDGAAPVVVNSDFGQFGGALGAAALALHRWKPKR